MVKVVLCVFITALLHAAIRYIALWQTFERALPVPAAALWLVAGPLLSMLVYALFPQLPALCVVIGVTHAVLLALFVFTGPVWQRLAVTLAMTLGGVLSGMQTVQSLPGDMTMAAFAALPLAALLSAWLVLLFMNFVMLCAVVILARVLLLRGIRRRERLIWLTFIIFPLTEYLLIDRTIPVGPGSGKQLVYLFFAVGFSILSDIGLGQAMLSVAQNAALKTRYAALQRQVDTQTAYYRQEAAYYERLRQLRHDMNNHVYTLKILLGEGRTADAAAYMKTLDEASDVTALQPCCEHPVAALYLFEKAEEFRHSGIELVMSLHIPARLRIKDGDLLSALGGLLNGAAARCLQTDDREIRLAAAPEADGLKLSASSACPLDDAEDTENENRLLLERLAARWRGAVAAQKQNGRYTVRLWLREADA